MTVCMYRDIQTLQPYIKRHRLSHCTAIDTCIGSDVADTTKYWTHRSSF